MMPERDRCPDCQTLLIHNDHLPDCHYLCEQEIYRLRALLLLPAKQGDA